MLIRNGGKRIYFDVCSWVCCVGWKIPEWVCRRAWRTNNSPSLDGTIVQHIRRIIVIFCKFPLFREKKLSLFFCLNSISWLTYLNFCESSVQIAFRNERLATRRRFFAQSSDAACLVSFVQSPGCSLSQTSFRQTTLIYSCLGKRIIITNAP